MDRHSRKPGNEDSENTNLLSRFDTEEPGYIPGKYVKPFKRSVYFPSGKGQLLYQAVQIARKTGELGVNEIVAEALELWIRSKWIEYVKRLQGQYQTEIAKNDSKQKENLLPIMENLKQELNRYESNPFERYQHFFHAVLHSMVEAGWTEMSGTVNEIIREDMIAAEAQAKRTFEDSDEHEVGEKIKRLAKKPMKKFARE